MAEGPFGVTRPFIKAEPIRVWIFFEFGEVDVVRIEEDAETISNNLESEGIGISANEVYGMPERQDRVIIEFQMLSTTIDIQTIEDIRNEVAGISGYSNIKLSTLPPHRVSGMR